MNKLKRKIVGKIYLFARRQKTWINPLKKGRETPAAGCKWRRRSVNCKSSPKTVRSPDREGHTSFSFALYLR